MTKIFRTLILIPVFLLCIYAAEAQSGIGTVRGAEILSEMPQYKDIEKQVEAARNLYQDTLQMFQQRLTAEVENFQKQQGVYSPEKRAQEEARINQLYQSGLEYSNTYLGPNGSLAKAAAELIEPLQQKIIEAIRAVAKQKKLAVVLNEQETLYADQTIDITLDVQLYLRNGK